MRADLDLRKVRYFVAVASTLNFRGASEELHIAQPVLSRQIRALEDELGTVLFVRGPRGTSLTAAGEQLLADAVPLLEFASATMRRARQAAETIDRIVVGAMPGLLITPALSAFREHHAPSRVEVVSTTWETQISLVRDGSLDISLAREPFDAAGLRAVKLASETRVALVKRDTDMANNDSLAITDLAWVQLLQDPDLAPEWTQAASAELRRAASRLKPAGTVEEKLERVASGEGFVLLPRSTSAYYRRPDVRVVPVRDLPPTTVSLVMRRDSRSSVRALASLIVELGQMVVGADDALIAADT